MKRLYYEDKYLGEIAEAAIQDIDNKKIYSIPLTEDEKLDSILGLLDLDIVDFKHPEAFHFEESDDFELYSVFIRLYQALSEKIYAKFAYRGRLTKNRIREITSFRYHSFDIKIDGKELTSEDFKSFLASK